MKRLILIIILTLSGFGLWAQSLDRLREEQRAEREEIARLETELRRIEGSQKSNSERLRLLNSKIESRRKLKDNIVSQIALLNTRQASLSMKAENNAYRLSTLAGEYRTLIEKLHRVSLTRQKGYKSLMLRYMGRSVADSLSSQAIALGALSSQVMDEVRIVELKKVSLDRLRASHDKEVTLIDQELKEAKKLSLTLKESADELSAKANERKARLDKLQAQIEQAVKNEIKTTTQNRGDGVAIETLSQEFAANKGKLPSPLAKGAKISSRYGIQSSDGVKINNKGIDLAAGTDRVVRAVFQGEVRRVFVIPAMGTCVMVRHGAYMTVYANLESCSVKVGENIATSAVIGNLTEGEKLHFELWKESSALNPSEWLFNIM